MPTTFLGILNLIGALGLFIYGIKVMSDGVQKLAGSRMRYTVNTLTSNRQKGVFTGFFTTSLLFSSSATTVMTVSFVNAGLLSLSQAIPVIMGANIGTSVSGWLVNFLGYSSVGVSLYIFPLLAIGVPLLFIRKANAKATGEFLIGFGLLALGLENMKHVADVFELNQNQALTNFINNMAAKGFSSILLFVFIGTIITMILQSSSAAMALTLTFCSAGLPFELGAALVLGENVGTTITANLAALVGNVHAKRAARSHSLFNMLGVLWMLVLFYPFLSGIAQLSQISGNGNPFVDSDAASIRFGLAAFHSAFNITNTLLLIWFVPVIEKMVTKITPARNDYDERYRLEFIETGINQTPELSILEAKKEIGNFAKVTASMLSDLSELVLEPDTENKDNLVDRIARNEVLTDNMEVEVSNYLTKLAEGELSEELSLRVRSMLSIINDLERVGDIFYTMCMVITRKKQDNIWFNQHQRENLKTMFQALEKAIEIMIKNLNADYARVTLDEAQQSEESINEVRNILRKEYLKAIEKGEINIKSGMAYNEIYSLAEKAGDHIINVTEAVIGEV